MTKIKVLRVMHRINIGGPTHHPAFLTKFLDKKKFETLLISVFKNGTKPHIQTDE